MIDIRIVDFGSHGAYPVRTEYPRDLSLVDRAFLQGVCLNESFNAQESGYDIEAGLYLFVWSEGDSLKLRVNSDYEVLKEIDVETDRALEAVSYHFEIQSVIL